MRWLDPWRLVAMLAPAGTVITGVYYFTARVSARPGDPGAPLRQQAYLRALATVPGLSVYFGHFLSSRSWMRLADPQPATPTTRKGTGSSFTLVSRRWPLYAWVEKTEEKGSDVNLATRLLVDAAAGAFDLALVVSNDSDLEMPVRAVREIYGFPSGS